MARPQSKAFQVIGLICCILAVTAAFIPTMLSTSWGKRLIEHQMSRRLDAEVHFDQVTFQWIGPQIFEGITISQPEDHFELQGDELSIEISFWNLILRNALPTEIQVKNFAATLETPTVGAIGFTDLNATTKYHEDHTLTAHILGNSKKGEQQGVFHLEAALKDVSPEAYHTLLRRPERFLKSFSPTKLTAHAKIQDFPVPILDAINQLRLRRDSDTFTSLLGDSVSLNIEYPSQSAPQTVSIDLQSPLTTINAEGHIDAYQTISLQGQLKSHIIDCPEFHLLLDQGILSLTQPAELTVKMPWMLGLKKTLKSSWNLKRAVLPLFNSASHNQDQGFVELSGVGQEPIVIPLSKEQPDTLTISSWQILLIGDPKNQLNYQATLESAPSADSLLSQLMGESLQIESRGVLEIKESFVDLLEAKIQATSPFGELQATGSWNEKRQEVVLKDPLQAKFSFGAPYIKELFEGIARVDSQAFLSLQIDPFHWDLKRKGIFDERMTGKMHISKVDLEDLSSQTTIRFKNVQIPFEIDGKSDVARVQWSWSNQVNGQDKGKSDGRIFLQHWRVGDTIDLSKTLIGVEGRLIKFPLLAPNLTQLLGDLFDAQIHVNWDASHPKRDAFTFVASGDGWTSSGGFQYQKDFLTISDAVSEKPNLRLELNQQRIEALSNLFGLALPLEAGRDSTCSVTLSKCRYPLGLSASKDKAAAWELTANLVAENLLLPTGENPLVLEKVQGQFISPRFPEQGAFTLKADSKKGQKIVEVQGNLQKTEGHFALNSVKAQWQQLPVAVVTTYLQAPHYASLFQGLIGPSLNGSAAYNDQGEVEVSIQGTYGKHYLKGVLQNQQLNLTAPMTLEITFNAYLQRFLQEVGGAVASLQGIEGPVTLKISEASTIPLDPFRLENMRIGAGSLQMGELTFNNSGTIHLLMEFLHEKSQKVATLRPTAIYFNLDQGAVAIERFDFLVLNKYPLALWGKLNLVKEKLRLNLGLTPRALFLALGVTGIPKGTLVQVPIRGSFNNPTIDSQKATRQVTKLVIENQVEGAILAPVMNLFAGGGGQSESAPAPTTYPLPWDTEVDPSLAPHQPASPLTLPEEPVKKLGKGVGSLLKSIVD